MFSGDGPPSILVIDDFSYGKIHMEACLEAIDIVIFRATTQELPKPKNPTNLIGDEIYYEKWNFKAKNTLFGGLCKLIFNRVWNQRTTMLFGAPIHFLFYNWPFMQNK